MLKKCVFLYKIWGINIRLAPAISNRFNPAARICNKQKLNPSPSSQALLSTSSNLAACYTKIEV